MVWLELQRERGGMSHFFTSGSEVRDYHKVKNGTFWGQGHTTGQDVLMQSVLKSESECLWGRYLSVGLRCMHGTVSLAHKLRARPLSEQSRSNL